MTMLDIELQHLILLIPVVVLVHYIFKLCFPSQDPREPPRVKPRIPVIGHILGLIQHGMPYYSLVHAKNPLPAFTLDLLATKTYIINKAKLVSAVQRNSRTISFDPFLTSASERMAGITGAGLNLLREKANGGGGLNQHVLHAMHPALLGGGLDEMNRGMIQILGRFLDEIPTGERIDLHGWCTHAITIASTDSVYGPLNPYRLDGVEEDFWTYESNLTPLLVNILPSITARKPWKARERIVREFIRYYQANGHETASALTKGRWKAQVEYGATLENIARLETAGGIGILSNTTPSTFWMLFDVYSRPELLQSIREEVLEHAVIIEDKAYTIDLAAIRDHCALLVSTFQEMLRLRSNAAPTRLVLHDILLADEYHLQKGSMLQMPSQSVNREQSNWGSDSNEFNPRRFMNQQKIRSTGFLSFGASPNMCPGRHFATGEIMATVAMMVLRYDISSVGGKWEEPKRNSYAIAASVVPPIEEFPVIVTAREDFEGVEWRFKVTEGKGRFGLVVG